MICSHGASTVSLTSFFSNNYSKLVQISHSRYGDQAEDVVQTALCIAIERKYEPVTMSLMLVLLREAARDLRIAEWAQDEVGTIIIPPDEQIGLRVEDAFRRQAQEARDVHYELLAEADTPAMRRRLRRSIRRGEAVSPDTVAYRWVSHQYASPEDIMCLK